MLCSLQKAFQGGGSMAVVFKTVHFSDLFVKVDEVPTDSVAQRSGEVHIDSVAREDYGYIFVVVRCS